MTTPDEITISNRMTKGVAAEIENSHIEIIMTVAELRELVFYLGRWPKTPACGARIRIVS